MRLFVALELPDSQRHLLSGLGRRADWFGLEAGNLGWVRAENLHVTLKFLGEVPDGQVPAVCDALKGVAVPGPLRLNVQGVTFFPPRGPIRVFVAEVGGPDMQPLCALQAAVEHALEAVGFPREGRPFRPHVTLARARRERRVPAVARKLVAEHPLPAGEPFDVDAFVLMRSELKPMGAIYTPAARFPLTPTPQ